MDNKLDLRYNDAFQVTRQKIQIKKKKLSPHTEKVRQLLDVPKLFYPFCGASQSKEVCRSQNSRLLRKKKKKKNVLHHY